MSGPHDAFISWAADRSDTLGFPFSGWLVARYSDDGRAMRDDAGRQVFETQAEYLARSAADEPIKTLPKAAQLELFS